MTKQQANVLQFIDNAREHQGKDNDSIRAFFRGGYCYYFALMLKDAFGRGLVCWAAPFGHMVWLDTDNTPYDIEGVYEGEATDIIPVSFMGKFVEDFKHNPETFGEGATKDDIQNIINTYRKIQGFSSDK